MCSVQLTFFLFFFTIILLVFLLVICQSSLSCESSVLKWLGSESCIDLRNTCSVYRVGASSLSGLQFGPWSAAGVRGGGGGASGA